MNDQQTNEAVALKLGLTDKCTTKMGSHYSQYKSGNIPFAPATKEAAAVFALERMDGAALAMDSPGGIKGAFLEGRWMCAIGDHHASGTFCGCICAAILGAG